MEAKQNFLNAANAFQPLGFARENPLISVCGAFMLGFGLTTLRGNVKALPMVPLLIDISSALLRTKSLLGRWAREEKEE